MKKKVYREKYAQVIENITKEQPKTTKEQPKKKKKIMKDDD